MDLNETLKNVTVLAALVGTIISLLSHARNNRAIIEKEAARSAKVEAGLVSINQGIQEIRLEQKDQGRRVDATVERVARVEESTKSVHKRVDGIDERVSILEKRGVGYDN